MKQIMLAIFILLTSQSYSQEVDKIYLKNKEVVSGKILVVTSENIEIDPVGSKPFLIIKRKDVNIIIYSDNTIVNFDTDAKGNISNQKSELDMGEEEENIKFTILDDLIDERDGRKYQIGRVGYQIWMLQDLKFNKVNGMYLREEALSSCPNGWHIPTVEEWREMFNQFGGQRKAGKTLKYIGNSGFNMNYKEYWTSTLRDEFLHFWFRLERDDFIMLIKNWEKNDIKNCRCIKD